MSVQLQGIPNSITELVQDRTLERVFHDAMFPVLLYRMEARPDVWQANLGEQMIFTRTGLIAPSTTPLVPGQDPTPKGYDTEQWEAIANQYGETIDTHMPSSYVTLASLFLRNTQQLGLNAGQSLDRLARDRLFTAYLSGETTVTTASGGGVTQVEVSSLAGFNKVLKDGRLSDVSINAPLPVSFTTAGEPDNNVIAFSPANAALSLWPRHLDAGSSYDWRYCIA